MARVVYSINGKLYKDFGVYISDSDGFFDQLKSKRVTAYDWPEYNGDSVDLQNPRFEARELLMKGFVRGENWLEMKNNFDALMSEFQKRGTQRLMVEPFGLKPLVYEVYVEDVVKLNKLYRDGEMVGVFAIKMKEPNPIKKVLKVTGEALTLSFTSSSETEIFWGDGTKSIFYGNVSITKDYSMPSYQSSGYSIVEQSAINGYYETTVKQSDELYFMFSVVATIPSPSNLKLYVVGRKKADGTYVLVADGPIVNGEIGNNYTQAIEKIKIQDYGKFIFKVLDDAGNEITGITFSNPRVESAELLGEWQDMTGKTKYVIVAGNVDEITDLTTNAEILWTKL